RHTRSKRDWSSDVCSSDLLSKTTKFMFDKERFIDLIMNFVVFDKGIKKVCRYNQYFGIKRTEQRLNNLRSELHNPNRDQGNPLRSEERRVGQESRYRASRC